MQKCFKKKNIVYAITVLLMLIPIIIAFIAPDIETKEMVTSGILWWKKQKEVTKVIKSPFNIGGIAAIYAAILYTIILIRNKNTIIHFGDENTVNVKYIILHVLDFMFLVTVCSLIPSNQKVLFWDINCRAFMIVAIIFSAIGMRSISGYIWIIVTICLIFSLDNFDNWGYYSTFYIVFSYMSLVSQIFILNIFDFNLSELMYDFGVFGTHVTSNISHSINTTYNTSKKLSNVVKKRIKKQKGISYIESDKILKK